MCERSLTRSSFATARVTNVLHRICCRVHDRCYVLQYVWQSFVVVQSCCIIHFSVFVCLLVSLVSFEMKTIHTHCGTHTRTPLRFRQFLYSLIYGGTVQLKGCVSQSFSCDEPTACANMRILRTHFGAPTASKIHTRNNAQPP